MGIRWTQKIKKSRAAQSLVSGKDPHLPITWDSTNYEVADTDTFVLPNSGRFVKVTLYRNLNYQASISGNRVYAVIESATEDPAPTEEKPALVFFRGGSVGHWLPGATTDAPAAGYAGGAEKLYEPDLEATVDTILSNMSSRNTEQFAGKLFDDGWRIITTDYSNHDGYMGIGLEDLYNPFNIPTTGLQVSRAHLDHFLTTYNTSYFFVHGTSAGSSGVWSLALQLFSEGDSRPNVAGLIPDAHWNSDCIEEFYRNDAVPETGNDKTYALLNRRMGPVGGNNPAHYMENIIGDPLWDIPMYIPYMTNDHQCGGGAVAVPAAREAGFRNNCDWNLDPIKKALDRKENSTLYKWTRIDTSSIVTPVEGQVDTTAHIVLDGKSNAPWGILEDAHIEAYQWIQDVISANWS